MRYLLNSHLTMGEKWKTGCGLTFKIWVKKLKDINISLLKLAFFLGGGGKYSPTDHTYAKLVKEELGGV